MTTLPLLTILCALLLTPPLFAQKTAHADVRLRETVDAVFSVTREDDLDAVLRTVNRIRDAKLRSLLKDWLDFKRAEDALYYEKRLDVVETFASKIAMLEPRAFLRIAVATQWLNIPELRAHARELIEQVVTEIGKAPPTVDSTRILFTASHAYLRSDLDRSLAILKLAIAATNKMVGPNFQTVTHNLEKVVHAPGYARFIQFSLPGVNPEFALSELARVDFGLALSQAATFTDKHQRALTTLSVVEVRL